MTRLRNCLLMMALLASGCAPIYTPPVDWTYDDPTTDDEFRPDMTECVNDFDPDNIDEMADGGEYEVTGWFVETSRTQAVTSCMQAKGWDIEGLGDPGGPLR